MSTETIERPEFATDAHLEYLDVLRDTAVTNMYGAAPWLQNAFKRDLDKHQARTVLSYWMKTYG